jgi:predicted PurR-regulated permease PerM
VRAIISLAEGESQEPMSATPGQSHYLRVLLVLAATVVVLVGMRLSATVLNPILFAVVLSLLVSPVYTWLGRRGIPTPLALIIMLAGLTILFLPDVRNATPWKTSQR